jgi:hypothetical protein
MAVDAQQFEAEEFSFFNNLKKKEEKRWKEKGYEN